MKQYKQHRPQKQHSNMPTIQDYSSNILSSIVNGKPAYSIKNKGQERKIIACRHKSLNVNEQLRTNEKSGQKLLSNQKPTSGIGNILGISYDSHQPSSSSQPTTVADVHISAGSYGNDLVMRKQMKHMNSGRSGKLTTPYGLILDNNNNCNINREIVQGIHSPAITSTAPMMTTTTISESATTTASMPTTMGTTLQTGSEIHESTENLFPFGCVTVEILKDEKSTLGLTVSDGSSQGEAPVILNIRPGSIAERNDCFLPYDHILSMNFTSASGEASNSGKYLGTKIRMEIGYELPALPPVGCTVKHMVVNLKIGSEGTGLVIRGGWSKSPLLIRPLTVMHVRQKSAADCDGRIKPGDRILTINSIHTGQLTCEEAMKLIQSIRNYLTLTIEYNVANFEEDRRISGAVVVEIEKPTNEDLGISLAPCHEVKTGQNAFFIDNIRQGSIADRCGALFEGDRVESIDNICVENMKLQEAMHRLKNNGLNVIRFQIVPNAIMNSEKSMQSNSDCLKSSRSLRPSITPASGTPTAAFRCEEVEVLLEPYEYVGYGFTLTTPIPNPFSTELTSFPLIDQVDPRGPAFKSGVIQEGDRVICINGQSTLNRTIDELIQRYLEPGDFEKKYFRVQSLTLLIQYTVADSVVPATGIFDVKLIRKSASLGINLQASINKTDGQPLLISKVIPGSVASRSGSINPGDILLAVNGVHLSSCSLSEAIQLLQSPDEDIIILRIQKMDAYPLTPGIEIKDSSDSSALHDYQNDGQQHHYHHQHQQHKKSFRKNFDENLISKCTKPDGQLRTVRNEDPDERVHSNEDTKKLSDNTSSLSSFTHSQLTHKSHQYHRQQSATSLQQCPIEKMFPNELEETDKSYKHNTTSNTGSPTVQNRQYRFNQHLNIKSQKTNQDELDKIQSDNILNQCMNSKLGYTLEPETNLVQVILKRKSPDCPWGITISGTDDAPDIPVLIDSVNPNDPGGECGLIQPGDRILAINGITLHNGHTLTQAMRMLQHFPDKVILHIARKSNFSSSANNPSIIPASSSSGGVGVMHSEQVTGKVLTEVFNKQREQVDQPSVHRKCTLKKAVASSNFSRSFDSISNSLSSNSVSNNFSDGQPLTGRTPVYRHKTNSSNIRLCNPEHYDDTKQALQKSRTLYDARSGAQVMDMSWPGSGNHPERNISKESNISNRLASKSSTTVPNMTSENFGIQGDTYNEGIPVENLNLKVPSNHPRSQTSKSHHRCSSSSSKRFTQPTPPQEQQPPLQPPCSVKYQITEGERSKYSQAYIHQYSDITTSEINDDADQGHNNETTNYPSHNFPPRHPDQQIPHYYPNKKHTKSSTDHLEMDLNFIECSGCRKAIEKEIKYYLSKQQKSYEGTYRASSSHRKDQSTIRSTSEAFLTSNYFELDFDHLQTHQPHPQQHYPPGNANRPPVWYLSKNDNQIPVSLIHEPSTFHYDKQQNQYQQQHSKNTEENTRVNQKKMTSSHMLSDHHSKSDSRLDLIRSIDLSDESSDIEKRNSLSVTYSTRMSAGSSQMHPPQNTYNCQSSVINPVKQKTISRIKSNTLGSPMNIQTNSSQFPKHIQRTHPKTSKSNKSSASKNLKHEEFAELNTWCTWIRLKKTSTTDSYGIGVSEGLSTLGIFVSAIRPNSPAELSGKLYLYDRILMVNDTPVDSLTCSEVVNLISRSEKRLDLLVQRRVAKHSQRSKQSRQNDVTDFPTKSSYSGDDGVTSGTACTSITGDEHINITAL